MLVILREKNKDVPELLYEVENSGPLAKQFEKQEKRALWIYRGILFIFIFMLNFYKFLQVIAREN